MPAAISDNSAHTHHVNANTEHSHANTDVFFLLNSSSTQLSLSSSALGDITHAWGSISSWSPRPTSRKLV